MLLTVELPWPPSINHYWRSFVQKRNGSAALASLGFTPYRAAVRLSKAGKAYRDLAIVKIRAAMWRERGSWPKQGALHARIQAYPPDARARDLDNLPKSVLDAFTHAGAWTDDYQVDHLEVIRGEIVANGSILVEVFSS